MIHVAPRPKSSKPPIHSPSVDAVMAAQHPKPSDGGPCATCAFRPGTQANTTEHTQALVRLCVEGIREFHCHEKPQLCRGFIAALNLRGVPKTRDERRHSEAAGFAADVLAQCIAMAKAIDEAGSR